MAAPGGPRRPGRLLLGFSFRWLMVIAVAGFALGSATVAVALVGITARSNEAMVAWRTYANRTSDKERQLRNYLMHMGVGGMIDLYSSYVMSGREELAPSIYARAGAALGVLDRYRQYGIDEQEEAAVATLEGIVSDYHRRVSAIGALHGAGIPVEEIAARAQIDDAAADEAMRLLTEHVRAEHMGPLGPIESKLEIVFDLRAVLGFRGLAQTYKSLMLHADDADRRRALQALDRARELTATYRLHRVTEAERDALAVIEQTLDAYDMAVRSGVFDALRADGHTPAQIDEQTAVATDPLLDALAALDAAMAREDHAARSDVATALSYVESSSRTTATLVIVSALFMIVASIWLLGFRVERRIQRLTRAMQALSRGDVHTVIPSTGDGDEIGEMSRSLLVFRDSIESNTVLARELAESSRLASLGALVAGIAHELNTPIGNALSVASALGEHLRVFSDEALSGKLRRTALEEFTRRANEAASLIERNLLRASQQIGSFKQIAVDQTGDQRRVFKLDGALKDVVESMRPSIRRARCSIRIDAETGVEMDGYPGALTQVIFNLVENSVQHGLADRKDGSIVIAARRLDERTTEVTVNDDGAGIPEDLVSRIFDAFFTTRASKGGSGLGLHIVNTLVSGPLGGEISVETKPGAGATFTLTLPNVAPERTAAAGQHGDRVYYAAA